MDAHPELPLTLDNFTLIKKPICEEPWEIVRQAGKSSGRKPLKVSRTGTSNVSPAQTPKVPVLKIKIRSGPDKATNIVEDTPSSSTSYKPLQKSSYNRFDDDNGEEEESDYDDEYDPCKEGQTPKWNKSRSIFHRRKGGRQAKQSPEREILIQSMPEPDIIIDRAEESPHVDESHVNKEEEAVSPVAKAMPRMMMLPGDIKAETPDTDEELEGKDKDDHNSNDIGTVRIYRSPPVKRDHAKPTARKSTMPRIALKKSR